MGYGRKANVDLAAKDLLSFKICNASKDKRFNSSAYCAFPHSRKSNFFQDTRSCLVFACSLYPLGVKRASEPTAISPGELAIHILKFLSTQLAQFIPLISLLIGTVISVESVVFEKVLCANLHQVDLLAVFLPGSSLAVPSKVSTKE